MVSIGLLQQRSNRTVLYVHLFDQGLPEGTVMSTSSSVSLTLVADPCKMVGYDVTATGPRRSSSNCKRSDQLLFHLLTSHLLRVLYVRGRITSHHSSPPQEWPRKRIKSSCCVCWRSNEREEQIFSRQTVLRKPIYILLRAVSKAIRSQPTVAGNSCTSETRASLFHRYRNMYSFPPERT